MPYNNVKFVFIIIFALVVDKVALLNISDEVKSICGIPQKSPKLKLKSRVSGGTESFHGNYPWLAAIMVKLPEKRLKKFLCGGSLISESHVITAAHCIHKKGGNRKFSENIEVLLGAHDLSIFYEYDRVEHKVKQIIIHDDYETTLSSNLRFTGDIAMIILYEKVTFTDYILPICIFGDQEIQFDYKDFKNGTIAGWGKTLLSTDKHSDVPNEIFVPITDNELCYRHDPRLASIAWSKSFCAGSEGKSACPGDSGSGFYVKSGNRFYLRGLVSSAINGGGCSGDHLVIFTDVFKYDLMVFRETFRERDNYGNFEDDDRKVPGLDKYTPIDDKQDEFDWNLTKAVLLKDESRNKIFSPLAAKSLLVIVAEGAGKDVRSETRTQLEIALPHNRSLVAAREYFGKVLRSIKDERSPDYTVNFESRVFCDQDVRMNQKFIAIQEYNYRNGAENLNFKDGRSATKKINDWISFVTEERIESFITEDSNLTFNISDNIVLLTNGLFVHAKWRYGFDDQFTRSQEFILSTGKKVYREFMHMTRVFYYRYSCKLNSRIIRIPYAGNKFSLFVVLPFQTDGINKVITLMSRKECRAEIQDLEETNVRLNLPKFQMEVFNNLKEVVKELGITEIFENSATLHLIARGGAMEGKLKISNIIQKTLIKVDEGGPITLSAQDGEEDTKCRGDIMSVDFNADHPFLFYIEDETTGAILLSGRVDDPQFQSKK